MTEKDNIQELLREKLQSHEVTPPDAVWQNVSNSLSNVAATSGGAAGASTLLKVAVAVIGVSGLGIATYFLVQDDIPAKEKTTSIQIDEEIESQETKTTEPESNDVLVIETEDKSAIKSTKESNVTENTVENKEAIVFEEQSIIVEENKLEPQSTPTEVSASNNEPAAAIEEVTENPLPQAPIEEQASEVSESSEEEIQEMPEVGNQEETFTETEEEVTLPNIFTPNNDGANDFFEINISEKQDFQIVVINHMNNVVFQSSSVDFRWDGMLPSGEPAPSGDYVYFISAKTMSGKDFVKSSKLRIQR